MSNQTEANAIESSGQILIVTNDTPKYIIDFVTQSLYHAPLVFVILVLYGLYPKIFVARFFLSDTKTTL